MRMGAQLSLEGQRFGRLLVLSFFEVSKRRSMWTCQCDCGTVKNVSGPKLKAGAVQSCGCLRTEKFLKTITVHGMKKTRSYRIWIAMKQRCLNPANDRYSDYGGRGIKVCDRWATSFAEFYADMGEAEPGMSLDRYPDTNGNYEPGNCRWATNKEQCRNLRNNFTLEYKGVKKLVIDWANEIGMHPSTLTTRLNHGWDAERALTTPIDKRKSVDRKIKR